MINKNTATMYICYRLLKRTGQPCGAKLDQVTSRLGEWVEWCIVQRATRWRIT